METVIKTVDLRKVYKIGNEKVVALDCINLEIEKGQVCCILGTSGSGKSTLLNQLAGLEKPTRGDVIVKSKKISVMTEKQLAHFRQRYIGFVFQSYNLLQGMSAVDNVAIPLTFRGMAKKKRLKLAKEMLRDVGLGKRMWHKPSEMSGGQQQRVGIARAFVAKPDVVFADEPTGNLDTRTTREVMDLFLGFARELQITIILVTHDQHLARYADRIVTIVDGNIIDDRLNRSLYDVTAALRDQLAELLEKQDWAQAADIAIHQAREHGDGVVAQALETVLKGKEDQKGCLGRLAATLAGTDDRELFRRIGVEATILEKDEPLSLPPTLPEHRETESVDTEQPEPAQPENTEHEALELIDATGQPDGEPDSEPEQDNELEQDNEPEQESEPEQDNEPEQENEPEQDNEPEPPEMTDITPPPAAEPQPEQAAEAAETTEEK